MTMRTPGGLFPRATVPREIQIVREPTPEKDAARREFMNKLRALSDECIFILPREEDPKK